MAEISTGCAASVYRALAPLRTDYAAQIIAAMNGRSLTVHPEAVASAMNRMGKIDKECRTQVSAAATNPGSSNVAGSQASSQIDLGLLDGLRWDIVGKVAAGQPLTAYDAGLANQKAVANHASDAELVNLNARIAPSIVP